MKPVLKMLSLFIGVNAAVSAHAAATLDLGDISGAEDVFFTGGSGVNQYTFNWLAQDGAGDLLATFRRGSAPIVSVVFDGNPLTLTPTFSSPQVVSLFNGVLTTGAHSFTVTATGAFGGTIVSSAVVLSVPESGALVLTMAGLGVVGLMMRRRAHS